MNYSNRETAFTKAAEFSAAHHCTFTVYKIHGASYDVINGVDSARKSEAVAQYINGKQRF